LADGDPLTFARTSTCAAGTFSAAMAQATTFTLPAGDTDTSCSISVAVNDGRGGSTSGQATLPVGAPAAVSSPVITSSSQSPNVVTPGMSVTFQVTANGSAPLAYRWRFHGTNLAYATNSTLTLTNVQVSQSGSYVLVVTNAYGTASSSNAVLTVNPPPPCLPPPSGLLG